MGVSAPRLLIALLIPAAVILLGCNDSQKHPQILIFATPMPSSKTTPPGLAPQRPKEIRSEQVRGFFVRSRSVYFILNMGGNEYSLGVAGVDCKPGLETRVFRAMSEAAEHRWKVSSASPITNSDGAVQVNVEYRVGSATRTLRAKLEQAMAGG